MAADRSPIISNGLPSQLPDIDPDETREWLDSLDAVVDQRGRNRARYLMLALLQRPRAASGGSQLISTDYINNTIPPEAEPWFPGDEHVERRLRAYMRWNAAIMVHRAQRPGSGWAAHLHIRVVCKPLRGRLQPLLPRQERPRRRRPDLLPGHASPGMYAPTSRGGWTENQLDGFRQELSHAGFGGGLPSYPHPRLMPDFWEFPTVSMGLGPINAIYQARFNRYLHNRGLKDTSQQRVGLSRRRRDGRARKHRRNRAGGQEELDNLVFVVNCNLQRLDGPVRGNGKIIQELEAMFRGAGWNVIKVIWGREWDPLLAADTDGALVNLMNETPDGDYQTARPSPVPMSVSTSSAATRALRSSSRT